MTREDANGRVWGWKGIRLRVGGLLGRQVSLSTVQRLLDRCPGPRILSLGGSVYCYDVELVAWTETLLEVAEMMLSKPCPKCGKKLVRRHTLGAPYAGGCPYFWWCRCLYTEAGGVDLPMQVEALYMELWELVNADALVVDALAAAERAAQELLGEAMALEYPDAEQPEVEPVPAPPDPPAFLAPQKAPKKRGRSRKPPKPAR